MNHFPSLDSAAEAEAPRSGDAHQLRDCSHLISLLADQVEALEQGNHPRLRELDAMRVRLAEEMRKGEEADTSILHWIVRQLEAALVRLESWIESDRLTRDQLAHLQDESLPLVRGIPRRAGSGNYVPLGPPNTQLDVRL